MICFQMTTKYSLIIKKLIRFKDLRRKRERQVRTIVNHTEARVQAEAHMMLQTWRSWRRLGAVSSQLPEGGDLFSHWRGTPVQEGPEGSRFHTGVPFTQKMKKAGTVKAHSPFYPLELLFISFLTSPNCPSPSFSLKMRHWRGSSGSGAASAPGLEEAKAGTA